MALPADNDKTTKTDDTSSSSLLQVGTTISDDKESVPSKSIDETGAPVSVTPITEEEPLGPPPSSSNQSIDGYGDGKSSPREIKKESEVSPPKPEEIKTEPSMEGKLSDQTLPPSPPPPPILDSSSSKTNIGDVPKAPASRSSLGPKPLGFAAQPTAPEKPMTDQVPEPPKIEEKKLEKPDPAKATVVPSISNEKGRKEEKDTKEKKKGGSKGKKVLLAVLGFFLLLGGLAAGYYYYAGSGTKIAESPTPSPLAKVPEIAEINNSVYCDGSSSNKCNGKRSGDSCGENSTCVWLKNQGDNTCGCTDKCMSASGGGCSLQSIGSTCGDGGSCVLNGQVDNRGWPSCDCKPANTVACNGGKNHGCGLPPDPIPSYQETANVGPFPEDGVLVIYGIWAKNLVLQLSHNGTDYSVPIKEATDGRSRVITNIEINAGDSIFLKEIIENRPQDGECGPDQRMPRRATGWRDLNPDNTCGTGVAGPPTGGYCVPYTKPDVSGHIAWAESFNQEILSKQCWADWREWEGDLDFEDWLLMFSYEPIDNPYVVCDSLSSDPKAMELGDEVIFVCDAQASNSKSLGYDFRFRIDGGEYQSITATENSATLTVNDPGVYEVECRACLISDSNICSDQWQLGVTN